MIDHAGDALSALLDGELSDDEATAVRAHVAGCEACARELDDVREARRMLRELPNVEPPAGWLDGVLSDGVVVRLQPRRRVFATVALSVAAGLLLFVVAANTIGPIEQRPDVDTALERHASTVSARGDIFHGNIPRNTPTDPAPATTAVRRPVADLPDGFFAPKLLAGYRLVESYRTDEGGVQLLYRKGQYGLSVFERRGGVDWSELPTGGARTTIAGHDAWRWNDEPADGRLVVIAEDAITLTIVADEPGDAVLEVASALPISHSVSIERRITRAVAKALELLSPAP